MTLPTLPDIGTDRRPVFWMIAIVLVIGMLVPLALLRTLDSEPKITLRTSSITVAAGTRSRRLAFKEVTEVALLDALPAPVNTFPPLQQLRPYIGPYRAAGSFLIVRRVAPPYLVIRSAGGFFLIRQETEEETRNLYGQVRSAWLSQQGPQE